MRKFNIEDYKNVRLRIFVIGYSDQGESIVTLFMDEHEEVFYTMVVDCYAKGDVNKTKELLDRFHVEHIDLLCWSHPDKDHSVGVDTLIENFCDDRSYILVPYGIEGRDEDCVKYNEGDKQIIDSIFTHNSRLHKAFKPISCNEEGLSQVTSFDLCSLLDDKLHVRLYALSPHAEYIAEARHNYKEKQQYIHKNDFSISLCLDIDDSYFFHYCSDIEDRTINHIYPDYFGKATFIKIPHHSSKGSANLLDLLPEDKLICCTTTYKSQGLPHEEVLKLYKKRSLYLHSTGTSDDVNSYGIIEYDFDLFGQHQVDVRLYGNAEVV